MGLFAGTTGFGIQAGMFQLYADGVASLGGEMKAFRHSDRQQDKMQAITKVDQRLQFIQLVCII
ncbi:hypothetical protein NUACC21_15290 [Scytonema sp. NUACC21]